MIEKTFIIKNKFGIHARPATLLVNTLKDFEGEVKFYKGDQEADGKSIMDILILGVEYNAPLKVVVINKEKDKEMEIIQKIEELIENKFYEE